MKRAHEGENGGVERKCAHSIDEIEQAYYISGKLDTVTADLQYHYDSSDRWSADRSRAAFLFGVAHYSKDYVKANKYFNESYRIASRIGDSRLLSDALHGKATAALRVGDFARVNSIESKCLTLAAESNHVYRIALSNYWIGRVALAFGSEEIGVANFLHALSLASEHRYVHFQIIVLSELAEIALASGDVQLAMQYAMGSLQAAHEVGSERDLLASRLRVATVHLEMHQYTPVTTIVLEIQPQIRDLAPDLADVASALLGRVYAACRRWKLAEQEYKAALLLPSYPNCEKVRSNIRTHLAQLYIRQKRYHEALKEALKAKEVAELSSEAYAKKEALKTIHECYKALGKFKEAHRALEAYHAMVGESDNALLKKRLEYHALRHDYEMERLKAQEGEKKFERLRIELEFKERELTEKTRHLIKQTEALSQFRDDLRAMLRRSHGDDPVVKQIKERVGSVPESQLKWEEFDAQFKAVHPEFLAKLVAAFPKLTPMERKICALLRLNLTSLDISKLLFLSDRNIENHRYRLRKKLGIDSTENLHEFLARY